MYVHLKGANMEIHNVMLCVIWYHLYNLKNMENTHGGVLRLVKLQSSASTCTNGTKSRNASHCIKSSFQICKSQEVYIFSWLFVRGCICCKSWVNYHYVIIGVFLLIFRNYYSNTSKQLTLSLQYFNIIFSSTFKLLLSEYH